VCVARTDCHHRHSHQSLPSPTITYHPPTDTIAVVIALPLFTDVLKCYERGHLISPFAFTFSSSSSSSSLHILLSLFTTAIVEEGRHHAASAERQVAADANEGFALQS
jgi:hypothetical protein